jgi:hypothetical protein
VVVFAGAKSTTLTLIPADVPDALALAGFLLMCLMPWLWLAMT